MDSFRCNAAAAVEIVFEPVFGVAFELVFALVFEPVFDVAFELVFALVFELVLQLYQYDVAHRLMNGPPGSTLRLQWNLYLNQHLH